MLVSMNWIQDFVDLNGYNLEELIKKFTLSTAEVEEIYFGLWSVEDGVLYSWTDGTAKADGISTEIAIETDFVTVNGIQFNRVK